MQQKIASGKFNEGLELIRRSKFLILYFFIF